MKERPILFSAPMVRALLDGSKTQTRRVVKPQPIHHEQTPSMYSHNYGEPFDWFSFDDVTNARIEFLRPTAGSYRKKPTKAQIRSAISWRKNFGKGIWLWSQDEVAGICPYGQPGDRLWVREAWRTIKESDDLPPRDLFPADRIWYEVDGLDQPGYGKYRPPMFMPRLFSRITLEITSVRVERLQDISEADAQADGVHTDPACPAYDAYAYLWEQLNGPGSWDANPWVWVVEFKRVQ